jgi:hypothetical protein
MVARPRKFCAIDRVRRIVISENAVYPAHLKKPRSFGIQRDVVLSVFRATPRLFN